MVVPAYQIGVIVLIDFYRFIRFLGVSGLFFLSLFQGSRQHLDECLVLTFLAVGLFYNPA